MNSLYVLIMKMMMIMIIIYQNYYIIINVQKEYLSKKDYHIVLLTIKIA